ncbi:MAG: c-type cytochrome, partial [Sulfitobacter sp.]|nr:c-type cytochrome [Sulfitobacter sp.]
MFRSLTPLALGALLVTGGALADPLGDAERGEKIFRQCQSCHQVGAGAVNRVGPHLNGVFGRTAGSIKGFKYSKSMARMGSDGLEWHIDTLHAYIENPKALVSKTRMNFRGIK